MSFTLPRSHLVANLFNKVAGGTSRFVHLKSPAATGKTSLLQFFQQFCDERGVTCIYVSMLSEDFKSELKDKTGIDADSCSLELDKNGDCVCADASKFFVVMLDDVQQQYDHVGVWTSLIKLEFLRRLPDNVRFVISATYSFSSVVAPVSFHYLPKLTLRDFRLSQEEVNEYVRLDSDRIKTERAGFLLVDPAVRAVISTHCNGHIGALSLSVTEIVKRFAYNPAVTVEEIVSFYLSGDMVPCFLRCHNCEVDSLPEGMHASLVRCPSMEPRYVTQYESPETYNRLVRAGVLEEFANGTVRFTTPAAARYINHLLFPHRAEEMLESIQQRGVCALMKSVLARLSADTLREDVMYSSRVMPSKDTFHHQLLVGLHAQTSDHCLIIPALSTYFPLPPGHVPEMVPAPVVERAAAGQRPVSGRCDFYLGGALPWVVEVLFSGSDSNSGSGSGAGKLLSRLESEDKACKYVGLTYTDYLVVDIQVNATGEPTPGSVRRNERRMSVFFKKGDFTFCNVLCGLTELAEKITLSE